MNPSEQVCSRESAKRLKELGVPQESVFYWVSTYDGETVINHSLHREPTILGTLYTVTKTFQGENHASAFTTSELGEMLPDGYFTCRWKNRWNGAFASGFDTIDGWGGPDNIADTEAEARAKMLIYLLENNLMKL